MSMLQLDGNHINVKFTEPSSRTNLVSGENLAVSLGKVKKYLNDLTPTAFSETDTTLNSLSNNPIANSAVANLVTPITQEEYDAITTKTLPLYFIYET